MILASVLALTLTLTFDVKQKSYFRIASGRAFHRRLARLATPVVSGSKQGAEYPPPPSGECSGSGIPRGVQVNVIPFRPH